MSKFTFEDVRIGTPDPDTGSKYVEWTFCVDGEPQYEGGTWMYKWKSSAEIAKELRQHLRGQRDAYLLETQRRIEL
jgi:hypothetical protein